MSKNFLTFLRLLQLKDSSLHSIATENEERSPGHKWLKKNVFKEKINFLKAKLVLKNTNGNENYSNKDSVVFHIWKKVQYQSF
jgi:hypothetical protein